MLIIEPYHIQRLLTRGWHPAPWSTMPSKLAKHLPPPSAPLFLSVTQPEAVPWTDVLESWHDALQKLNRSMWTDRSMQKIYMPVKRRSELGESRKGRKEKPKSQRRSSGNQIVRTFISMLHLSPTRHSRFLHHSVFPFTQLLFTRRG